MHRPRKILERCVPAQTPRVTARCVLDGYSMSLHIRIAEGLGLHLRGPHRCYCCSSSPPNSQALRAQRTRRKTAHLCKLLDLGHKLGCSSDRLYIPSLHIVHIIEVQDADARVGTREYSAA